MGFLIFKNALPEKSKLVSDVALCARDARPLSPRPGSCPCAFRCARPQTRQAKSDATNRTVFPFLKVSTPVYFLYKVTGQRTFQKRSKDLVAHVAARKRERQPHRRYVRNTIIQRHTDVLATRSTRPTRALVPVCSLASSIPPSAFCTALAMLAPEFDTFYVTLAMQPYERTVSGPGHALSTRVPPCPVPCTCESVQMCVRVSVRVSVRERERERARARAFTCACVRARTHT